jgi:CheY-like chemotaxis protein
MSRPTNALIVDDEAHVQVFLRLLLKELGVETTWSATDGAQALAMAAQHHPELVLLDVNLPVMNGLEVLQKLGVAHPGMPVIMVSSQSAMKTVLDCVKLGAVAYVLKHSPKAEALKMLREALDSLEAAPADEETEGQ